MPVYNCSGNQSSNFCQLGPLNQTAHTRPGCLQAVLCNPSGTAQGCSVLLGPLPRQCSHPCCYRPPPLPFCTTPGTCASAARPAATSTHAVKHCLTHAARSPAAAAETAGTPAMALLPYLIFLPASAATRAATEPPPLPFGTTPGT
jgi:hypothetical protein